MIPLQDIDGESEPGFIHGFRASGEEYSQIMKLNEAPPQPNDCLIQMVRQYAKLQSRAEDCQRNHIG